MKKFLLLMVLCLCALSSVQAQNAQVAQIRKQYAEAKEIIANSSKEILLWAYCEGEER